MEEIGKPENQRPDGQLKERTVLHRFLFWLFVVFAIGDAPFAASGLLSSSEQRGTRVSRDIRFDEHLLGYLTPVESHVVIESAESERVRLKAFTGDCDDGASGIFLPPALLAGTGASALALASADHVGYDPATGFSSRAPPQLAIFSA